ncbi:hypothetical protein NEFER03_1850 [Nematocida sp. LUAm3]|nr:hypothetical protein NEFER03_1850 [Nematocida sp. LUAm3]KAI5174000.1 hypothetical protein NEFER02_0467 [Nematocida sp. LUAm2]KAI5177256.1 hypothetical protein NEFER01_0531 [Nematocida sp. LUAm1]
MDEETEQLFPLKALGEDIVIEKTEDPLLFVNKNEGFNRTFRFTEALGDGNYRPVLQSVEASVAQAKVLWKEIDFFEEKTHLNFREPISVFVGFTQLCINKSPEKGSPYIMYKGDGLEYMIRKERLRDSADSVAKIKLKEHPKKIGLYKNICMILSKNEVSLLECSKLNEYSIPAEDCIDMAIPEGNTQYLSVLRNNKASKGMPYRHEGLLDILDIEAGKTVTHLIKSNSLNKSLTKVCTTWHPQQYICATEKSLVLIDRRDKSAHPFWSYTFRTGTPSLEHRKGYKPNAQHRYKGVLSLEKGQESKIIALLHHTLATIDLRSTNSVFFTRYIPIDEPRLAVGRNLAVYNSSGEFIFQSQKAQDNYLFKNFNIQETSTFRAFDWYGKNTNTNYSISAFLFDKFLRVIFPSGKVQEHKILTRARNRALDSEERSKHTIKDALKKIHKLSESTEKIIERIVTLPEPEEDTETHMEKYILKTNRNPPNNVLFTPPDKIKELLTYSKLSGSLFFPPEEPAEHKAKKHNLKLPSEHASLSSTAKKIKKQE